MVVVVENQWNFRRKSFTLSGIIDYTLGQRGDVIYHTVDKTMQSSSVVTTILFYQKSIHVQLL